MNIPLREIVRMDFTFCESLFLLIGRNIFLFPGNRYLCTPVIYGYCPPQSGQSDQIINNKY